MMKSLFAGSALLFAMSAMPAFAAPACDADNGGLTLPTEALGHRLRTQHQAEVESRQDEAH